MTTQRISHEWLLPYGPFTGLVRMSHSEAIKYAKTVQGAFGFLNQQHVPCVWGPSYPGHVFNAR